jgi:hypothetical protein
MNSKATLLFVASVCRLAAQTIENVEIDFNDIHVRSVMDTMFEVVRVRDTNVQKAIGSALSMSRGKAVGQELTEIRHEMDESNDTPFLLLERRLQNMGLRLDDEKVITALAFAKSVLSLFREIERTFRSE